MRMVQGETGGTRPRPFGRQQRTATAIVPERIAAPAPPAQRTTPRWLRIGVALVASAIGIALFRFSFGRAGASALTTLALGMFLLATHQVLRCFGMSLPLARGRGDGGDTSSGGSWFGCSDGDGGSCDGDGGGD